MILKLQTHLFSVILIWGGAILMRVMDMNNKQTQQQTSQQLKTQL